MVTIQMPAVCRDCRRPFPSGFAASNVRGMTFSGTTAGPCPYCSAPRGDVPDGVYDVIDGTVSLIEQLPTSRSDLLLAAGILQRHLEAGNGDVDAIEREIVRVAPSTRPLVALLRDPATASVLAAIAIVVSIIFGVLSLRDPESTSGRGGGSPRQFLDGGDPSTAGSPGKAQQQPESPRPEPPDLPPPPPAAP